MSKDVPLKPEPLTELVGLKVTESLFERIEKLKPYIDVPEMHRKYLLRAVEHAEEVVTHKLKGKVD